MNFTCENCGKDRSAAVRCAARPTAVTLCNNCYRRYDDRIDDFLGEDDDIPARDLVLQLANS